jgi:hypothetical protein
MLVIRSEWQAWCALQEPSPWLYVPELWLLILQHFRLPWWTHRRHTREYQYSPDNRLAYLEGQYEEIKYDKFNRDSA